MVVVEAEVVTAAVAVPVESSPRRAIRLLLEPRIRSLLAAAEAVTREGRPRVREVSAQDQTLAVQVELAQSLRMVVAVEVRRRVAEAVVVQTTVPSQAPVPQSVQSAERPCPQAYR